MRKRWIIKTLGRRPLRIVNASSVLRHAARLHDASTQPSQRRSVVLHSYSDDEARRALDSVLASEALRPWIDVLAPHDPRLEDAPDPHQSRLLDQRWKVTLARILDVQNDLILLPFDTPGVRWEAGFWLSMLPMRRVLMFIPAPTAEEWSSRTRGILQSPAAGPTRPKGLDPVTAAFGVDSYEVAVRGHLPAECLPFLVGLRLLHRRHDRMPQALRGRLSATPWRALLGVEPWDVQRRLLHQLWSERAALKHLWPYDKRQWTRVEAALESSAHGRPVADADALAELLHTEAVKLYERADAIPEDQRMFVTRSAEEWRLFAQLLRTRDSDGNRCWGPRPPGDIDEELRLSSAGALRHVAANILGKLTTRMSDWIAGFHWRR